MGVKWWNLNYSFSPLGESLSFACSKDSNQRKEHPPPWPTASLRYSTNQAAAELAALRQSSPKTPDSSALLGMAAGDLYGAMPFSYCAIKANFAISKKNLATPLN